MRNTLIQSLESNVEALIVHLDLDPTTRRLFEGRVTVDEYAAFLEQTYHYVRWTRPLCERAGKRLAAAGGGPLATLLLRKAAEESGHEDWALADLAALGRDPNAVVRSMPMPATAAYIAWNRFTAEAGAPEAFLGTAHVLEVLSAQRAALTAENLVQHSGIPGIERAVRFLRGHGHADEAHTRELVEELCASASAEVADAIVLSARVTRELYQSIISSALSGARRISHPRRPQRRRDAQRRRAAAGSAHRPQDHR